MKRSHQSVLSSDAAGSTESPVTVKKEKAALKVGPLCLAGPNGKIYGATGCAGVRLEVELGGNDTVSGYLLKTDRNTVRLPPSEDDALELFIAACASRACPEGNWDLCASGANECRDPRKFFFRIVHTGPPEILITNIPCDLQLKVFNNAAIPALEVMQHRGGVLRSAIAKIKVARAAIEA